MTASTGFSVDGQVGSMSTFWTGLDSTDGLQSIIVAGGSKGLGREIAAQLVQRGMRML